MRFLLWPDIHRKHMRHTCFLTNPFECNNNKTLPTHSTSRAKNAGHLCLSVISWEAQRNKCGQRIALRRLILSEWMYVCFIVALSWASHFFFPKTYVYRHKNSHVRLRIDGKCKWNQFREYDHWSCWANLRIESNRQQSLGENSKLISKA